MRVLYLSPRLAQLVKKPPAMQETLFNSWVGKIRWRRDRLPTPVFLSFPCGSAGKESTCNVGDLGSIPGLGRSPGEGKGYPLQYCGLENSMDCIVHGVTKSQTWLSDFHFTSLPFLGFPGGSVVKNPPANAGDMGSSPGLGRSPGEGNGDPLQYSCLRGNLMDRGAWRATVHGVAMSQTWLSDFPFQLR